MRHAMIALAAVALLGAAAAEAAAKAPARPAGRPGPASAASVVAAERAFAARAAVVGVAPSFLEYMTDDAIIFAPDKVNAREFYGAKPPAKTPKDGGPLLAWWPNFAGVARSGDIGFTTGPATINGGKPSIVYFTVWARQPGGGWKWIYDGGIDADGSKAPGPSVPPRILPLGDPRPMAPDVALHKVKGLEGELAAQAAADVGEAYFTALAKDAVVQGSSAGPAATPAAVRNELATRAKAIVFTPGGGGASRAGDLVWTYGDAVWTSGRGHYVRIWQRRNGAFVLVFDQLIAVDAAAGATG